MATVKTALSIDEMLFADGERVAAELQLSRSSLYALALRAFLERRESQRLVDEINSVSDNAPVSDTDRLLRGMRKRWKRLAVEDL